MGVAQADTEVVPIENEDEDKEKKEEPEPIEQEQPKRVKRMSVENDKLMKKACHALRKSDIEELKCLCNPPSVVKHVAACAFYLNPTGKEARYLEVHPAEMNWHIVRHMLSDDKIMERLRGYDPDSMTLEMYSRIAEALKLHEPLLDEAMVKKTSKSALGLFKYVMALVEWFGDHNDIFATPTPLPVIPTETQMKNAAAQNKMETEIEAFERRMEERERQAQLKIEEEQRAAAEALQREEEEAAEASKKKKKGKK